LLVFIPLLLDSLLGFFREERVLGVFEFLLELLGEQLFESLQVVESLVTALLEELMHYLRHSVLKFVGLFFVLHVAVYVMVLLVLLLALHFILLIIFSLLILALIDIFLFFKSVGLLLELLIRFFKIFAAKKVNDINLKLLKCHLLVLGTIYVIWRLPIILVIKAILVHIV